MFKFFTRYNDRFVSKWLVLLLDVFISTASFVLATIVIFNFDLTYLSPSLFKYHLLLVICVRVLSFLGFKTYAGIIRHTSIEDGKLLFKSILFSSSVLIFLSIIGANQFFLIPLSILVIDFFTVLFGLVASRFVIKATFESLANSFKSSRKIIIYGSGSLGIMTKNTLLADSKNSYQILCFIDDNPKKIGKSIESIKVLSKKDAQSLIKSSNNNEIEIIFSVETISPVRKNDLVDEFLEMGIKIRVVPPIKQWINGNLSINQIHEISIEDLLERPAIQINNRLINDTLYNKKVMITGAAGSIGSELVRQILSYNPSELILIDQAESPLYDLESELSRVKSKLKFTSRLFWELKNITDEVQMHKIFEKYKPQVVFHAAAYKHVPLMEADPYNAVEVNTYGTKLLADLASKYKVEKFVFISTDKAVNPTNVMGASKRLSEIYVQSLNASHKNETRFIITRFGNVLGSNGSVIPLFKKQIAKGGPVTVTHPDIIRYFMTIPEASQLVLEACTMGKGGEIFVFDMGLPVKIYDLAVKMITLSGFQAHTQIPIEFSGLRSGEKLYEELLGDEETTMATHNPKIMIAKVKPSDYDEIKNSFEILKPNLNQLSENEIVGFLKKMVPEFISNNSPFEILDETKNPVS